MIESGWCRETINHNVIRVKKVFRWAAAEQLLPPTVHAGLACVPHLSKHRSDAREAAPKGVLKPELIRAVEPYVTPQVWALIQLQLHCCARAGELLKLRVADLDMSDEVWSANLREHKNAHRGHRRMIFFGVPGQVILRPFLENRSHDAYLFCPRDAVRYRHRDASHHRRSGQQPTPRRTERVIKEHYTTASYRRAVYRACVKAFPIPDSIQLISDSDVRARRAAEWRRQHYWSPHDLRHFAATRVRDRYNVDVSQVLLGHKRTEATQIYAEVNYAKAREVMLSSESIW